MGDLLPNYSVPLEVKQYRSIGEPFLSLRYSPVTLSLPDLRHGLVYHGVNGRPDASPGNADLHFSLMGADRTAFVKKNKPLYLLSKHSHLPRTLIFSPNNAKTSLWIEATPKEFSTVVTVYMVDRGGKAVTGPEERARFVLPQQQYAPPRGRIGHVGKWKVESTLLSKQGAAWYGKDRFMEAHGGQEFEKLKGHNRLDFSYDDATYSIYIKEGDALAWENGRWNKREPGPNTIGKTLLVVGKTDKLLMRLELWDAEGKVRTYLSLLKQQETWFPHTLVQNLKFIGALTSSQMLVESDGRKRSLSPRDWLLLTEKGWKILKSVNEIDEYVERREIGPLFIVEKVIHRNGGQALQGYLFNASRTDGKRVILPFQGPREPLLNWQRLPNEWPGYSFWATG